MKHSIKAGMHTSLATIALLAMAGGVFSCTDLSSLEPTPQEIFDQNFVKRFGVPQEGHLYSDAVTNTFTMVSRYAYNAELIGEIDGKEYTFAQLGTISGRTDFIANVPKNINRLFVRLNDNPEEEYDIQAGKILNIESVRAQSPAVRTLSAETNVTSVERTDYEPQLTFAGNAFLGQNLLGNFKPEQNNLDLAKNFLLMGPTDPIRTFDWFTSERFKCGATSEDASLNPIEWINIYPVFTRPNKYGESDYVIGIYYRHTVSTADRENMSNVIHYDLTTPGEFDNDSYWVTETDGTITKLALNEWFGDRMKGKNYGNGPMLTTNGIHVKLNNFRDSNNKPVEFGFYLKSGMKDNYLAPNHRDFTHITYMESYYNRPAWENHEAWTAHTNEDVQNIPSNTPTYYDTKVEDLVNAYGGVYATKGTIDFYLTPSSRYVKATDNIDTSLGVHLPANKLTGFFGLGFNAQPRGTTEGSADFADMVLILEFEANSVSIGRMNISGTTHIDAFPWILAAEDLGSTDDWDYNDLVVAVSDVFNNFSNQFGDSQGRWPVPQVFGRTIKVTPLAAGSTLPNYLMYQGSVAPAETDVTKRLTEFKRTFKNGTFMVGTEIHSWLGESDYTKMLNTTSSVTHKGRSIVFNIEVGDDRVDWMNPGATTYKDNNPLAGFWLLVDAKNEGEYMHTVSFDPTAPEDETDVNKALMPFNGQLGQGAYRVDAPQNTTKSIAPQMILTFHTWAWPKERVSIGDAYLLFPDWVKDKSVVWSSYDNASGGYFSDKVIEHENLNGFIYYK